MSSRGGSNRRGRGRGGGGGRRRRNGSEKRGGRNGGRGRGGYAKRRGGGGGGGRGRGRGRRGAERRPRSDEHFEKANHVFEKNERNGDNRHLRYTYEGVEEDFKIKFARMIEAWRETDEVEIVFPPNLGNKERKYLHTLAKKLGLKSKSRGKGEKRFLTISKKGSTGVESQIICPSKTSADIISRYYSLYPLQEAELSSVTPPPLGPIPRVSNRPKRYNCGSSHRSKRQFSKRRRGAEKLDLPVLKYRDEIVRSIENSTVTIVSGATGCGKSTQCPQFILDAWGTASNSAVDDANKRPPCNIICTQPRRISAVGLAHRVADERGENVGETVGYAIRLERSCSPSTQLLFCTTGVLLRRLMDNPMLESVTHVVVDEIHERDSNTDFLLVLLRDLAAIRADIRIVLMSATIQTAKFRKYFRDCPMVEIPGRTFDVKTLHLEHVLAFVGYGGISMMSADDEEEEGGEEEKKAEIFDPAVLSLEEDGVVSAAQPSFACPDCGETFADAASFGLHSLMCVAVSVATSSPAAEDDKDAITPMDVDEESAPIANPAAYFSRMLTTTATSSSAVPRCPRVGRAVLKRYQERSNDEAIDVHLIASILDNIYCKTRGMPDGAALVFLPGWGDILELSSLLYDHPDFGDESRCMIVRLHSMVPTSKQREAFVVPPQNMWKIVLSTNIAETSITIPDASFVIDCGKAKKRLFDPFSNMSTFLPSWISKASCKQRAGRAGRCRRGVCFRIYSTARYESFDDFDLPEILRVPLDEIYLQAIELLTLRNVRVGAKDVRPRSTDVAAFLAKALDPPKPSAVSSAIQALHAMGAFRQVEDGSLKLSVLGSVMAKLPLPPTLSKMLIMAAFFNCLDPVLTTVCAASYRSPFVLPMNDRDKARAATCVSRLARNSRSDHIALLNAYKEWRGALKGGRSNAERYCRSNFLCPQTMWTIHGMRRQLEDHLRRQGFIRSSSMEKSGRASNAELLVAVVCAGLYPNVAMRQPGRSHYSCWTEKKVRVHMNSVNAKRYGGKKKQGEDVGAVDMEWLVFQRCTRGLEIVNLEMTTAVSPFALVLFCGDLSLKTKRLPLPSSLDSEDRGAGNSAHAQQHFSLLKINDFISFHMQENVGSYLRCLRTRMQEALWCFVSNPRQALPQCHAKTLEAICGVLKAEARIASPGHPGRGGGSGRG